MKTRRLILIGTLVCIGMLLASVPVSATPPASPPKAPGDGGEPLPTLPRQARIIGQGGATAINDVGQVIYPSRLGIMVWTEKEGAIRIGGSNDFFFDLNDRGQAVGATQEPETHGSRPFMWTRETGIQPLTLPGVDEGGPTGINNVGQMIGDLSHGDSVFHAFVWTEGQPLVVLDAYLDDINDLGQAVSSELVPGTLDYATYLWTAAEGFRNLNLTTAEHPSARPVAINNHGQITGNLPEFADGEHGTAFLWSEQNGVTEIVMPSGDTVAVGINDLGQVIGRYWSDFHPKMGSFVWTEKTGMVDLPSPFPNTDVWAVDINNHGQVLGYVSAPYVGGTVLWQTIEHTQTTVSSSSNPSIWGESLTFTANVVPVTSTVTLTGRVQFQINGSNLGSPVPLTNGSATSPAVSNLSIGTHTVTAIYTDPDASWNYSTGTLLQTVEQAMTKTQITGHTPDPSTEGQSITVNFRVTSALAGGAPTGSVKVTDGASTCIGSVSTGSCTLMLINPESKTLIATYSGDGNYLGSQATVTHAVTNLVPTLTSVTRSGAAGRSGGIILTATGTNLLRGSLLLWNQEPLTTEWVSPTQLSAQVPFATSASIAVRHPGTRGDQSNVLQVRFPAQDVFLYLPLISR